jgi:hypothetical protein
VRFLTTLLLALCLAGCNRSAQNKEAVRQGILDHLKERQFSMTTMNVDVTAVQFNGTHAEATVSVYPKAATAADGMVMKYKLEQQGGKWVVAGRGEGAGMPHGGAAAPGSAMPGAASPHGGAAMPPSGGSMMPSPGDLPPAGQKK